MSRGKRYNGDTNEKLNIKKVAAVIIFLLVVVMFVVFLQKITSNIKNKDGQKEVALAYYTIFENDKWGVMNSKGELVIIPSYDEMIVIPNPEKPVFLITYDVNYEEGSYKTKAVNEKNKDIFTSYSSISSIQNKDKQNIIWYSKKALIVKKDGKVGLIDFNGKILLECKYDDITPIMGVENSLVTTKDGKKGLVDEAGTIIIENEYSEVKALTDKYENGYIVKGEDGKYGVITPAKKTVVPVKFDEIKNVYGESIYVVKEGDKLKLFNSEDEKTVEINAKDVKSINSGNVIISNGEAYGTIDLEGKTVIEAKYQNLTFAFGEYYIAKLDNKYGIISKTGETKLNFEYDSLIYRKDADFIEGQKSGSVDSELINKSLEVKLKGIISEVNVSKGYIKLRVGTEYKYYNFKFEEKSNIDLLANNTLFLSKKDGKYGYVDKNGVVKVNYIYDDAKEQNDSGYVAVKKDGKWGALDQKGDVVVEPTLKLDNNPIIDFIGTYHLAEDANAGYYTK